MDTVIQFRGTVYENGYGLIAQKVMRDKDLSPVAKSIYAYICSFAGVGKDGERTAFPGVKLMMYELGIKSEDTYYKHRKQLLEKGYISIEKQRQEGKFDKNVYYIEAVPVPQNVDTEDVPPPPKKSGTAPYPKKSSTKKSSSIKLGTNINSININSIKKEEEEEEQTSSELISFLLSKGITLENALLFENRLLREGLTEYTEEQIIEAIYWSLQQFLNDVCNEPYVYAVGRLKRMLDGKVKTIANKPKKNQRKGKAIRKEMLPEWFDQDRTKKETATQLDKENHEQTKREIEEMLKKLRA